MKYKRRSTGEEKVQKIAAGEEGNYRMERVPLKQTDRHHKSPGGDLCIRDRLSREKFQISMPKMPCLQYGASGSTGDALGLMLRSDESPNDFYQNH
uniref:hypothetical protein n=1 Tax=Escherichia coli TaxID=562 RepID=UPI0015EEA0F4|nr:hypothetical protein [Escherichia coli]